MIPRSPSEIESEAKKLGQRVTDGRAPDNNAIQVLCALVEELAQAVDRLKAEIRSDRHH